MPTLASRDPPAAPAVAGTSEAGAAARPATPRYLTLAKTLMDAIQCGTYPIGSLLPTEIELSRLYGVSRQTVRQATGLLRQKNVLFARKGVGTRVEANSGARRLSYSAASVADLLEIAQESELLIEHSRTLVARGALATALGCRAGHRWLHLAGPRTADGEARPFSWVNIYVSGRIAQQMKIPPALRSALFQVIEKQTGNTITDIQQEIRAVVVGADIAERIEARAGSPALEITRRYFSTGRRLVLVSVSLLPADRFFYSVAIRQT